MAEENYCYAASGLAGRSAHFAWGSLLKLNFARKARAWEEGGFLGNILHVGHAE